MSFYTCDWLIFLTYSAIILVQHKMSFLAGIITFLIFKFDLGVVYLFNSEVKQTVTFPMFLNASVTYNSIYPMLQIIKLNIFVFLSLLMFCKLTSLLAYHSMPA